MKRIQATFQARQKTMQERSAFSKYQLILRGMADRSFPWGAENSPMRRATELGGRRRHDQQRLLVELELDDSLYQGTIRAGMEQNALCHTDGATGKRSKYVEDTNRSRYVQPSYDQEFSAEAMPRLQSRVPRDSATKPLTERQMQQYRAKRLSSPYKLKQQVLGTRNDPTSQRYHQKSTHNASGSSTQRVIRSPTLQQSPAQLVIESVRQNMHLRDQVVAHLQQELMGVLPLHRASRMEKSVPQRVVKLLNRMRSLSLAVVEAVVYLSSELGDLKMFCTGVEHDILEQDFYRYLLQMASSDTDFLACSPPLQRFFEDFEVNLTRNPFVDGLSLDSSEVLLCSCHQSASSGALFCSASSSSSSLLRLLTQKLETFAFQTQRYLPGWQILPAERVAAALLHLMDLETRFNAVRMLPRYLQSHNDSKNFLHQHHERDGGYGTFEDDERIHRLDRHNSLESRRGSHDLPRVEVSVMEAWAGSPTPTAKNPMPSEARLPSSRAINLAVPYHPLTSPKIPTESVRSVPKKEEDARKSSSAWIQMPSPTDPASSRTNSSLKNANVSPPVSATSSKLSAGVDSTGNEGDTNVEATRLALSPTMLDMTAISKTSSRSSSSDKSGFQKKSRIAKEKPFNDRVQINQESIPPSARNISARSLGNEAIQVSGDEPTDTESAIPQSVTNEDGVGDTIGSPASMCDMESLEMHELIESTSCDYLIPQNVTDPEPLPSLPRVEPLVRDTIDKESDEFINVMGILPVEYHVGSSIEYEVGVNDEGETGNDDEFKCDFGYSSNEALSSIAMALQMLPNLSFSNVESPVVDEVVKPEEAIPPIEFEDIEISRTNEHDTVVTESDVVSVTASSLSIASVYSAPAPMTTQYEAGVLMESVGQGPEIPPSEDDEYAYSSTTALSNIAMALSLLPSVSRDDVFSVPIINIEPEHEFETQVDVGTPRSNTYRSVEEERSRHDEPWQIMNSFEVPTDGFSEHYLTQNNFSGETSNDALYSVPASSRNYDRMMISERPDNSFPISSRSNSSPTTTSRISIEPMANDEVVRSKPASSRSNISAATSYQGDDDIEPSEFNRIFALCRDIQVAAFDMSHWVSQREVEDHIQSVAQPFSSLMGYLSPVPVIAKVDDTPKYLERELKMLRRNFASWKVAVTDQKRAKLVVRRLVARRKVRQFVLHHHRRRLQAWIEEENRLRFFAASRIQRNWSIYCYNKAVAKRKATFRVVHMAFHRTLFFVGISQRRRHRENAKERMVLWWRHQRVRIKKKKQRQEKLVRERELRARALRDIQKFLKEILLRRRLKAAQEMTKNILFKHQLKWTKAKRDVEKTMKLNSKHRRELIDDMNSRFVDLDRKWKTSEDERLLLLTHHERVIHQQQQAVQVQRRRLAALKIQMFFRVCLLHKRLQKVEMEKKEYEIKLQRVLLTKEKRELETQKHINKTRTQVRVLERKINRMALEALETDDRHREAVQAHQQREIHSHERAARQKIKAFIDARTLCRRADSERRRLLLEQARLQIEKTETELMSSEDQRECHRAALLTESDLKQRLSELEARSEALLLAKNQLAVEKELEAQRAAAALEHSKVKTSMQQIASWVSGQVQLSKFKKEKAAISASAAREMMEERQRQCREIDSKKREVASIKASNFMHQRISQHRNHKTVEAIRIQQYQKSAQEKSIATRTRAQLVQTIIDVKLLTERETNKGITEGLVGVAQFYKAHMHKFARLKNLRSMNFARKIQRAWRRWIRQQRIKRAEELAFAQLIEAKRRQALARKIQNWWRMWVHEQQRRREQQLVFDTHLESIRVRALVRRIQEVWRHWVKRENERRLENQLAFEEHLNGIRLRANARKIQGVWKQWVLSERERRYQQQFAVDEHLKAIKIRASARKIQGGWKCWVQREQERRRIFDAQFELIRVRANVRKIQGAWRRWFLCEQGRRHQQQLVFDERLLTIRVRASVRKIQGVWRRWIQSEQERRCQQQLSFDAHVEAIRMRANVRKIQRVWRCWVKHELDRRVFATHLEAIRLRANARKIQRTWRQWIKDEQVRKHVRQLAFEAQLNVIRVRANVRKIQGVWRRWINSEQDRRCQQQLDFERRLEAIRIQAYARKIQCVWRQWAKSNRALREGRRTHRLVFSSTHRIQRWWRKWQQRQRVKATRDRIMRNACAQVIQRKWKRWHRWRLARRERQRLRIQQEACARRLQNIWRQWREWKRRRDESAKRILEQKRKMEAERVQEAQMIAAIRIQQNWCQWQCKRQYEQDKARKHRRRQISAARIQSACYRWWKRRLEERCMIRAVTRIQRAWRRWCKRSCEKAEQERQEQEERSVALKIQQNWAGKLSRRNKQEDERKRCVGAQRIQRKWRRWHRHEKAARSRNRLEEDQRISAILLQRAWKKWHLTQLDRERQAQQEQEHRTAVALVDEDEQLQQEFVANVLKIQTFWRKEQKQRDKQREMERVKQTRNTSSLKIQRNWGIRQHRRKMERKRIQHEQHMAALKIQTLWLKWHHEQQEEIERERIRQEQDESSMKIQQNWGISHQRRKLSQERIRHKQNLNALKIQKHWRRWRHLRLEQRTQNNDAESQIRRISLTKEPKPGSMQPRHEELQQKLDVITHRSYGRCIARAVRKYLQNRREASAATKIEAIWKGKLCRAYYLRALEEKHAEEVRQYQLMISVLATKVQVCWRQWNVGVRQLKRAAVKSEELRLIEEAKTLERKLRRAKRELAAKRIQRALASRRALIATRGVSHREIIRKEKVPEQEATINKGDEKEPVDQPQIEEFAGDLQVPAEVPGDPLENIQEPIVISQQDLIHATVELTVEYWSHRQLPHILSCSVNQILFCHEAVSVLQKCFRDYQRRQMMHFYFQRSLVTMSRGERGELEKRVNIEPFHFYFVKSRAWLDWDASKSTRFASLAPDTSDTISLLRLRFDSQMTRKLLQLFESTEEYLTSEIQEVLHEITADVFPILMSPICLEDNDNPRPELRYHDVGEMELPLSVKLLRLMGQHRAHIRRKQILEVDTSFEELTVSPPSPVAKPVSSSPIGRSAPSSPSQRAKKEVTIFTAVENASVDDATFLQQRGADLGALEPKTQRNALHTLSFSKENFRSRADMLEFLLSCGANLNVNGVDCNGDTPLMLYASLGHLDFMQKLLEHGADIQKTNNRGQNVLHRACEEDQVEICGFLQQLMMKDSITEETIPVDTVAKFVPTALVLHTPDSAGRYPLHFLAEKGFVECAKQLVVSTESNYEWNRTLQAQGDSQGRTVLHLAIQSHDIAMTAFLLTPGGGSNVNCFDDLHRSPLHYAVESPAALPIISRLIQHGASVNVPDERGDTPLHWAAFLGRAAVAQNLLALGADPTLTNSDWETPAQIAAAYGQLDCMRLLLQAQRRHGAALPIESKDHQEQPLIRPANEKTALQRLEEAVNELHQKQASYRVADTSSDHQSSANGPKQSQGGYWEELHQDVQLVEESGQFSSEDEDDLLFGHDNDMNF